MFIELEDTKNLLNLIYVCDCTSEDNVVTYTMTNGSIIKEILSSAQAASDRVTDVKNAQIGGGGGSVNLQDKSETITTNTTTTIQADNGYDGLRKVSVTTNVPAPAPNLQNKSETITENKTTTIQADTGYDGLGTVTVTTNVSEDCFTNTISNGQANRPGVVGAIKKITGDNISASGNSLLYAFNYCVSLESVPVIDTSNVENIGYAFQYCSSLVDAPLWNTEKVFSFYGMFQWCSSLKNVPIYNTSSATNFGQMFANCPSLTNDSLNNIMKMCINATVYTGTKTLATLGLTSAQALTCQGLSNYQDFIDAGWTTGY